MEGEGRLDQARRARRRLGVADLRLDRAEGAPGPLGFRRAVDLGECRQLDRVADLGPGPVGLDQLDRVGRDAGLLVGPAEAFGLAGGAGGVDSVAFTVAGRSDPLDHGVDPVAVAPGVVEPLQGQDAQAFAEGRAVSAHRERAGVSRGRERGGLAEAHIHEDVVEGVEAARQGDVAPARGQFHHGEVDRTQRTGAGGVDHAVGPAQVEAVGDPTGRDVPEQARERILLPADVRVADPLDDLAGDRLGDSRVLQGPSPDRMAEPGPERDDQLESPRHAENHADPFAIDRPTFGPITGVVERRLRDHQAEELGRVGGVEVGGGDPEVEGREIDGVEEAASSGVGPIGGLGVGVVVIRRVPVSLGDLSDRVDTVVDIGPVTF